MQSIPLILFSFLQNQPIFISCPLAKNASSEQVLRHWIYMVERITQVGDDNGKVNGVDWIVWGRKREKNPGERENIGRREQRGVARK